MGFISNPSSDTEQFGLGSFLCAGVWLGNGWMDGVIWRWQWAKAKRSEAKRNRKIDGMIFFFFFFLLGANFDTHTHSSVSPKLALVSFIFICGQIPRLFR